MKRASKYDELSFIDAVRPGGRDRVERRYFEYTINRRPLRAILDRVDSDRPSVFGWLPPKTEVGFALQLLMREPSELKSGRVPLYICPECADLGCGCVAVRVSTYEECVVWSAFGIDGANRDELEGDGDELTPDLRDFYFLRSEYEVAIGRFSQGYRMRPDIK